MKKYLKFLWAVPILVGIGMWGMTSSTDIWTKTGRGASWGVDILGLNTNLGLYLNNASGTEVWSADTNGVTAQTSTATIKTGGLAHSSLTVAISTTNTTGTSNGVIIPVTLSDGNGNADAVEGSVLVSTVPTSAAATSMTVQTSTGAIITNWVGIAATAISTGSTGQCYISGVVLALTTGTVAAGDLLVTTGSAVGYLAKDNTDWGQRQGSIVGIALGTGISTGGLTKIRIR